MPLLPYRHLTELPDRVQRHLPTDAQEVYLQAYNRTLEQTLSHAHSSSPPSSSSTSYSVHTLRQPHTLSEHSQEEERIKAHNHRQAWKAVREKYEKILVPSSSKIEPNPPIELDPQITGIRTTEKESLAGESVNTTTTEQGTISSQTISSSSLSVASSGPSSSAKIDKHHHPIVWIKKYEESLSDKEEEANTLPPLTASGGNV